MLPWRRSKFVLAEDECKSKPKSLSVRSLLCAVLRTCPDLLPDPFTRLGSIFRSRRQTVELNAEEPSYSVRYLGSAVTVLGRGEEAEEAVAQIWSRSGYGQQSAHMKLSVGPHGIRMADRRRPAQLYSLHRITYCAPDPVRPKICAWIYRHQVKNKAVVLRCHAVLLPRAEKAQALALSLSQTSTSAFSEFKRLKRQSDARHRQQQRLGHSIVPLMPLRRRLNGQCHYQPAERPGNTTRLCSITEEEEEEEVDEEEQGKKQKEGEEFGEWVREEDKKRRETHGEDEEEEDNNSPLSPKPQDNLGTVVSRLDAVWISSLV